MGKAIKKTLTEQLELLNERSKETNDHLKQLVEITAKILHFVEFPVQNVWSAETGWQTKANLEQQAAENSARLVRRLVHRRPTEAMIKEWLNEC